MALEDENKIEKIKPDVNQYEFDLNTPEGEQFLYHIL